MSRIYLLLAAILLSTVSYAQYNFTYSSSNTYQSLSNPISLNSGAVWDQNTTYPVSFFNFSMGGQMYSSLEVIAGGGVSFGQNSKFLSVFLHTDSGYLLMDKDSTNSSSDISYEISGTTGNRVLKVQWKNAGFRDWCPSTYNSNDSVNFQIWLFENDSHFEVHFGTSYSNVASYGNPSCNTGSTGPQVKLNYSACSNMVSLNGQSNTPSAAVRNHCFWMPSVQLSGTPSNGMIYTFTPTGTVGLKENKHTAINVYPNPVSRDIQIEMAEKMVMVTVYSALGKEVISTTEKNISIESLATGIYYLSVQTDEGILFGNFVKQ